MKLLEQEIYKQLSPYNDICFGPLIGELGWEIILISGFIKKYKKDFPDKKIYVCTRTDRKELYENCGLDNVLLFDIPDDYVKFTPRGNSLYVEATNEVNKILVDTSKQFRNLKESITDLYPDVAFFSFEKQEFASTPPYDLTTLDYTLNPNPINSQIIKNIIEKKENVGKTVVTIFSRHRKDLLHRNWTEDNWKELFKKLKTHKDYLFFISGITPSYVKPRSSKNMYVLENIQKTYPNSTTLGLCIESIRNSRFTTGPQTSGILLSNILKIPSLFFGKELDLVNKNYNPFNTYQRFLEVEYGDNYTYKISVDEFYNNIINFVKFHESHTTETDRNGLEVEYRIPSVHPYFAGISDPKKRKEKIREFNMSGSHKGFPLELVNVSKKDN